MIPEPIRFQGKLFKKLLLHFLVLVFIPTLVFGLFYTSRISELIHNVITNNSNKTMEINQKDLESRISSITEKGLNLSLTDEVKEIIEKQNLNSINEYAYVALMDDLQEYIRQQFVQEDYVHSIYIYNPVSDYIATPFKNRITTCKVDEFIDTTWIDTYNVDSLKNIKMLPIRRPLNDDFGPYIFDSAINIDSDVISFLYPIRWGGPKLRGVLVVNFYEAMIPASIVSDNILILDNNSDVIYPFDLDGVKYRLLAQLRQEKVLVYPMDNVERLNFTLDQTDYTVSYTSLSNSNVNILKIETYDALYKELKTYQLVLILISFITIVAGLVYSINAVIKIYNPVRSIMSMLDMNRVQGNENELTIILDEVTKTMHENAVIGEMLSHNEQNIFQGIITNILRGNPDTDLDLLKLKDYNTCLILSMDYYITGTSGQSLKDIYAYKTLILQASLNILRNHCHVIGTMLQEDKILLILSENQQVMPKQYSVALKEIQLYLRHQANISVSCSISNCYEGIEGIRLSYKQCLQALSYRMSYGRGSIILFEEFEKNLAKSTINEIQPPVEVVLNFIKSGDRQNVEESIDYYVALLKESKGVSRNNLMEFFYPLIYEINLYLDSIGSREDVELTESLYGLISSQEVLEDVGRTMKKEILKIIDLNSKIPVREDPIIGYIKGNYMDCNLDITKLSDLFSLSYSHIRKRIKDASGESFSIFINRLRIEEAKEMLSTEYVSVKEIAYACGYNSEQSLIRNFKKLEGVTPKVYRQSHC